MTPERKRLLRIIRIIVIKKRFTEVMAAKDHYKVVERPPSRVRFTFNALPLSPLTEAYVYVKGHFRKRGR